MEMQIYEEERGERRKLLRMARGYHLQVSKKNALLQAEVRQYRHMEQSLKESEEKYRTIVESIEDGYYEVDLAGNLVFFNQPLCRMLGYSPEEMTGMNNRRYMSEETAKRVYETFNEVYRTKRATKAFDWELVTKQGEKKYVETSVSLIRNQKGEPMGFRGIARDISEVKALEKARERVINHLSHELGTPLSIIEGALVRISREAEKGDVKRTREWVERAERSVKRLKGLQGKMDDIVNRRPVKDKEGILHIIEAALSLLDELKEEPLENGAQILLERITARLDSLYNIEEIREEKIPLDTFMKEMCEEAILSMKARQVEIVRDLERGICLEMDRKVLKKVCDGLLRNAIENTPDEGRIEIRTRVVDGHVAIDVQDYGVGITSENQKMIFGGFFHTQDTNHYASRKPYLFNAGGSGSDLLRAKVFAERFGFSIGFSSRRCRHLPADTDECAGRISSCPHIPCQEDCFSTGGSTFSLHFPVKKFLFRKENEPSGTTSLPS